MNETLKEHIELKANGTMAGKRFLHLDEMNQNYNYAANTYLIALAELATLREAGEKMAERLRVLRLYADKSEASAAALEAWEAANK